MKGRAALLCLLFACSGVQAGEERQLFNRIGLQAEASREVANDRMRATLFVQGEETDPARLAERINKTMAWVLERARRHPQVRVESEGYTTQPVYRDGTLQHWRARQGVSLESSDFPELNELLGALQGRVQIGAMGFFVSEESQRQTENRLIDAALAAFKERAERVRSNLDASGWRIVELHVGTGGRDRPPQPLYMARGAAMESVAAPAAEAGASKVTVTVSGTIQLLPAGAAGAVSR